MVDFLDRVAGIPENIFCRYNPGGTFQLGESEEGFQVMDKPGDAKYGMTEEQMIDSYKKLAAKGAKNFGIHAFLASNTISDEYYPELAAILFQLAVRVQKATGVHIAYINLSGGVGIPYRPDQTENDIMAIGEGVRKKFEEILVPAGMGDVARCSIGGLGDYYNEDLLYRMFGINAELLIDHAWGYEPVTMDLIKSYRPETNCISSGQVLHCATDFMQAKIVVREMAEQLAMDLVEKKLVTDQIVLTVGYDIDNLKIPEIADHYHGEITVDRYGRSVPKHAHGTGNLDAMTASVSRITETTMGLYERIVDPMLLTRRITLVANHLKDADSVKEEPFYEQMDLFSGGFLQTGQKETSRETKQLEKERLEKEKHLQEAMLSVKSKYGKNAILKAADLQEGATTIDRNRQIGGHKA